MWLGSEMTSNMTSQLLAPEGGGSSLLIVADDIIIVYFDKQAVHYAQNLEHLLNRNSIKEQRVLSHGRYRGSKPFREANMGRARRNRPEIGSTVGGVRGVGMQWN